MTVTPTPETSSATTPTDVVEPIVLDDPTIEERSPVAAGDDHVADDRWMRAARVTGRTLLAILGALVVFGIVMASKGVNPLTAYREMITSTFSSPKAIGEIFIRGAPVILAALAVTVPARAGLINVGGEGQLMIGGVAAAGVSLAFGTGVSPGLAMVLMIVAAMIAAAAWSAIAGALRLWVGINEAVTTLLMNYIALDLMRYLIYDSWKDRQGSGQPVTPPIPVGERLPLIGTSRVHLGIVLAVVATGVVWFLFKKTSWGFRLGVVGGNAEAARRAGLRVGLLLVTAMAVGGAMAGLGGFVQLAGTEFKLRPDFLLTYGYIGFLASWLGKHRPWPVMLSALALSAITIGGDSLQLDSKLPAASVNILMALLLLAVFGFSKSKKGLAA